MASLNHAQAHGDGRWCTGVRIERRGSAASGEARTSVVVHIAKRAVYVAARPIALPIYKLTNIDGREAEAALVDEDHPAREHDVDQAVTIPVDKSRRILGVLRVVVLSCVYTYHTIQFISRSGVDAVTGSWDRRPKTRQAHCLG